MNTNLEIADTKSMVYSLLDQVANMNALIEDVTDKLQALAVELELQSMPEMDDDEIKRIFEMYEQEMLEQEAEDAKFTDDTVISQDLLAKANAAVRKALEHRVPGLVGNDSVNS